MRHSDLRPGDVVCGLRDAAPWVVLKVLDGGRLLYLNLERGTVEEETDGNDHWFYPGVVVLRDGVDVNTQEKEGK